MNTYNRTGYPVDPGDDVVAGILHYAGVVLAVIVGIWLLLAVIRSARLVQEYEQGVVLRLGRYVRTVGPGLRLMIPFLERMVKVDRREVSIAVQGQEALSRDNVPVKITVVVWTKITNARNSVIEVENARAAVERVALTSLVTAIGKNSLDHLLKERDTVSADLKVKIDNVTEKWGYEVTKVEIQNVEIPPAIQRAMAAVAEADRERQALIIKAQGEFEASKQLADAGRLLAASPGSLELRRLQALIQIGAEHNSTTVVIMPSEFIHAADSVGKLATAFMGDKAKPEGTVTGFAPDDAGAKAA